MPRSLVSNSYAKRKRRIAIIKAVSLCIFCILCVAGAIYLTHLEIFGIDGVTVGGTKITDSEKIKKVISEALYGSYALVVPKSFTLVYPKMQIKKSIIDSNVAIKDVDISLSPNNQSKGYIINANITEEEPFALWCDGKITTDEEKVEENVQNDNATNTVITVSNDFKNVSCFYVNKSGLVFSEAPVFSNSVFLIINGPISFASTTVETPIGQRIPVAEKIVDFDNFVKSIKNNGITVKDISYDAEGVYVFHSVYKNNVFYILMDDRTDFTKALSNFVATLKEYGMSAGLTPLLAKKLEYVDIRFGKNIIFKWQETSKDLKKI
ncbi:MAG: hypothetical protein NTV72_02030 [Candidatus Taylorbacteria bacterium]|nr:hypothetical protein [Candidatus Taylorbacteria bacterium]